MKGLSIISKEFDKTKRKKSNNDNESNDDKDNEINFLKLVKNIEKYDRRSFIKSEDIENEKNNIKIKLDEVMEDLTYEVAEKYQRIKTESSNQN